MNVIQLLYVLNTYYEKLYDQIPRHLHKKQQWHKSISGKSPVFVVTRPHTTEGGGIRKSFLCGIQLQL